MGHFRGMSVALLYVGYLLILALHPFEFDADFANKLSRFFEDFLLLLPHAVKWSNWRIFTQKFLLYIPLGLLLSCSLTSSTRRRVASLLLASMWGTVISFLIELCQVFFAGRHPSLQDLLLKVSGANCGVLLLGCCPRRVTAQACRWWGKFERSNVPFLMVLAYGILLSIVFASPSLWLKLRNWDSTFTFQLGNEPTLNRPWLGQIYLVALYNRALAPEEITQHFHLRFSSDAVARRVQEGLIALYTFGEGTGDTVHDVSTVGAPLDLTFSPGSHIRWLRHASGIEILQPAIIKSQEPAKKLVASLRAALGLSIEVWINPRNTAQTGRIVSFSRHAGNYNFRLEQEGANIQFRLRTPILGSQWNTFTTITRDNFLSSKTFHIVATYKAGKENLYVNGKERLERFDLTREMIVGFVARKSVLAQIAYSFFYFSPMSFFFSVLFSRQCRGSFTILFLSTAIGTGFLSMTEVSQAFVFERTIDWPLIGYGVLTGLLGAVTGITFAQGGAARMDCTPLSAHAHSSDSPVR